MPEILFEKPSPEKSSPEKSAYRWSPDKKVKFDSPWGPKDQPLTKSWPKYKQNVGFDYLEEPAWPIPSSDDGPWMEKTLLSLDGGGVRGLSSLLVLQRLMEEIGHIEWEDGQVSSSAHSPLVDGAPNAEQHAGMPASNGYYPCHYFDFIAGSSTGGLVAILLGRLKLGVDEAIKEYQILANNVFQRPSTRLSRLFRRHQKKTQRNADLKKHSGDVLRQIRDTSPPENALFKSDALRCRTIAYSIKSESKNTLQTPVLFRSYPHPHDSLEIMPYPGIEKANITVWNVISAVSGIPAAREPFLLDGSRFYDAAIGLNNPAWAMLREVRANINPDDGEKVGLVLSIGDGRATLKRRNSGSQTRFPPRKFNDHSNMVDQEMIEESTEAPRFQYYRINKQGLLAGIGLTDWKPEGSGEITFQKIKSRTLNYLESRDVQNQVRQIAEDLVRRRRSRARTVRWEQFAKGTRYQCPLRDECPLAKSVRFESRNDLLDHLRLLHHQPPPVTEHFEKIQLLLDQGRTNSDETDAS